MDDAPITKAGKPSFNHRSHELDAMIVTSAARRRKLMREAVDLIAAMARIARARFDYCLLTDLNAQAASMVADRPAEACERKRA